jgi:hypothetical protein
MRHFTQLLNSKLIQGLYFSIRIHDGFILFSEQLFN